MAFNFASALSTAQKIKLVCALALEFRMDYTKVSTWDGYYCSELLNRRRLQQTDDIIETEEDKGTWIRLMQSGSTNQVVVFFGVNTQATVDTSQTTINAQTSSALVSKNYLI